MGVSQRVLGVFLGVVLGTGCAPQSHQMIGTGNSSAIIGGTAVGEQDPINISTVQLLHVDLAKDQQGHTIIKGLETCTGTILSQDIILTAGHCSSKNPRELILLFSNQVPDFKAFFQTISQNKLVRRVVAGVTAPNWQHLSGNSDENWGDLSLLRFTGGLPEGYVPATLLPANAVLAAKMPVTLAGFGETDGVKQTYATELLKVTVQIADPNFTQTEMQIDNTNGEGACHGDSGGPAYVSSKGQNYLAGVTSRADIKSDPQAVCVGKTIYTKVQPYLSWISTETQKLEANSNYGLIIAEPVQK
ncbi:S1 family peptidase [Bdellovibrio svalbardensis]|uniref:Trypsin-like serine protease n=1 Tax=Bdellovibrio svalbardensis TaxID=2972972 RepID=A0ABT6DIZ7_9BACT|nr:trypsin-like serine protease [Bdellovibrio svalbardensis]MDG0816824.1 trypsin-like serine protease [Bdellovibrio svalbardensis]